MVTEPLTTGATTRVKCWIDRGWYALGVIAITYTIMGWMPVFMLAHHLNLSGSVSFMLTFVLWVFTAIVALAFGGFCFMAANARRADS